MNVRKQKRAREEAKAERLELLNTAFAEVEKRIADVTTASELLTWTLSLATLIDKRRLEEGLPTSRTGQQYRRGGKWAPA